MSSFTENLHLKRQIQKLNEENNKLRKLISEAAESPSVSGMDRVNAPQTGGPLTGFAKDSMYSPQGYGRDSGRGGRGGQGNGTGGPLYTQGYLPPEIMNFIIRMLGGMGGDVYGLVQNGQINWANWLLNVNNNPQFNSYSAPLLQAINTQLGTTAMQQFATAFRQWQASQARR